MARSNALVHRPCGWAGQAPRKPPPTPEFLDRAHRKTGVYGAVDIGLRKECDVLREKMAQLTAAGLVRPDHWEFESGCEHLGMFWRHLWRAVVLVVVAFASRHES